MKLEELNAEEFKTLLRNHLNKINNALNDNDVYDTIKAYKDAANDGVIGYLPNRYHFRWTQMINDGAVILQDGKWILGDLEDLM